MARKLPRAEGFVTSGIGDIAAADPTGAVIGSAAFVATLALLAWLTWRGSEQLGYAWQWYRVPVDLFRWTAGGPVLGPLLQGMLVTVGISIRAMVLALALGVVTAAVRLAGTAFLRGLVRGYIETIRGTPLLVQLYLFYFILSPLIGIGRFWTGVLALAMFESVFAAEVMRGAIQAVPPGQWEAARALGLRERVTWRHIIFPQAVLPMLPPLAGILVSLIKDSAIVSVISVFDLTYQGRNIISSTFMSFEIWTTVAVLYLIMTISLSALVNEVERRVRRRRA
ncbi:MAG: amino acid ABC transporter permease [Bradyrhizobium sp.]